MSQGFVGCRQFVTATQSLRVTPSPVETANVVRITKRTQPLVFAVNLYRQSEIVTVSIKESMLS